MKQIMRSLLAVALAIGVIGSQVVVVLAQPNRFGEDRVENGQRRGALLADLDLTVEQREKLKGLKSQRESQKALREQVKAARQSVRSAMQDDSSGREEILRRVRELNGLSAEQNLARAEMLIKMREILTPEQRKRFREKINERKQQRPNQRLGARFGRGDELGRE